LRLGLVRGLDAQAQGWQSYAVIVSGF